MSKREKRKAAHASWAKWYRRRKQRGAEKRAAARKQHHAHKHAHFWRDLWKRLRPDRVPGIHNGWHPDAERIRYGDSGTYRISAPARIVWHTTETDGLPTYSGTAPHFTFNPKTGDLYQHIPIDRCAEALEHNDWPETNHAHAIHVELIGRAAETPNWSDADYRRVAELARWIEKHAGVKRRCGVKFDTTPHRMSPEEWLAYDGHCGHEHVPHQYLGHWDPGALRIDKVI